MQLLPPKYKRATLGAVYTPSNLANWVVSAALGYAGNEFSSIRACDPACGNGELLMALQAQRPDAEAIGIDIDPVAIKRAQVRFGNDVHFVRGNVVMPAKGETIQGTWKKLLNGRLPNLYLMNPPWGMNLRSRRIRFEELGLSLSGGQFDSYEIFCETVLRVASIGSIMAFILPDSIFYSEKQNFRRHLLETSKLHLIARLGEGFFDGVFRATSVVIAQKGIVSKAHKVHCLRLLPSDRDMLSSKQKALADISKEKGHAVRQERFLADRENRFDLDLRSGEETTIERFRSYEPVWSHWLKSGRGVEISKTGRIALCPQCKHAGPFPQEIGEIKCRHCSQRFLPNGTNAQTIIVPLNQKINNTRRIIVGEDVDRYAIYSSRAIIENVPGIDYKRTLHSANPRILVRKTGLGIKAALDVSGDYTNQVVFMYYREDRDVPDFFLYYVLGVLCSRVTLAYFLRTHGEVEWKSHPYVTQKILNAIPIPTFTQGSKLEKQARAIADAVQNLNERKKGQFAGDVFIDCLVAGLYKLTMKDCRWIVNVLNQAEALEPIRSVRLDSYDLLKPIFAS